MESFESKKTLLEEAQRIIDGFEEGVENEFQRTANTWPECFGGHIFPLETYLDMAEKELDFERHKKIMERLEKVKERVMELKEQYPDRNSPPPEDVKKELSNLLKHVLS